jgi:hypothetical protein
MITSFACLNKITAQLVSLTLIIIIIWLSFFSFCMYVQESRGSSVGLALVYGLEDRGSRVRFPPGSGNFSLHHRVQNGSGTHPASYPVGTGGSFPGGKAAGAWRVQRSRMHGAIPPLPNTSSWRAYLSTGTTLPLPRRKAGSHEAPFRRSDV